MENRNFFDDCDIKARAIEVDFKWNTIEECVEKLKEYDKMGENVYISIGRYVVYSSDATVENVKLALRSAKMDKKYGVFNSEPAYTRAISSRDDLEER